MKKRKSKKNNCFFSKKLSFLHPYIASQIENEYWHHRSKWMEEKLSNITKFFHKQIGKKYTPLIITSTEKGALEAVVSNLVNKKTVVCVSKGGSWEEIVGTFATNIIAFDQNTNNFGEKPDVVFIDDVSEKGEKYNLNKTAKKIKNKFPGTIIIANISTSFASDSLNFEDMPIDGYVIVPEKALGGIPGLSILSLNLRIFNRIKKIRKTQDSIPYTFDLLKYKKSWEKDDTPYSPDISASVGLNASLEIIEENGGIKSHLKRQKEYARVIRNALQKEGFKLVSKSPLTNAFTVFSLPKNVDRKKLLKKLRDNNITLDTQPDDGRFLLVGHTGYLEPEHIKRFTEVVSPSLKGKYENTFSILQTPKNNSIKKNIFSIPVEDWLVAAEKKTKKLNNADFIEMIMSSSRKVYSKHSLHNFCFKNRTLGFIGAGNTVREAVHRCQKVGIKNIIVYSPSLADQKKKKIKGKDVNDHKSLSYWENRGITVASSYKEVFLTSHTVVLLPTFYTKQSAELLNKSSKYINEGLVNEKLLEEIKNKGRMDLLINASAREKLIDRKSLAKHLKEGWLLYHSDETPKENDPVTKIEGVRMTGHVGGSCPQPQKAVAKNTRIILKDIVNKLHPSKKASKSSKYKVSLMNSHLKPKGGWRVDRQKGLLSEKKGEVRILITDSFDHSTLDLHNLAKECGVKFNIIDTSKKNPTETYLNTLIEKHRPHILMVRTRTVITKSVAQVIEKVPELCAIVRPGVGIDSIYGGMEKVSSAGVQIINEPYGNSFSVGEMATHFIIRGINKIILTPGPTRYSHKVFKAIKDYSHPNSNEYKKIEIETKRMLETWIGLGNKTLLLSAPSTAFMDASIKNITQPEDRGLIVSHGKFGNRFKEISTAKQLGVESLEVDDKMWGKAFTPKEISDFLQKDTRINVKNGSKPFKYVTLQQNETSTGVSYKQNHLEKITKFVRKYNPDIIITLDGVSGFFGHHIDVKKLDIDMVVLGSQKGIGASSGLTYASISNRMTKELLNIAGYKKSFNSFRKLKNKDEYINEFGKKQSVYYLNLLKLLTDTNNYTDTNTPSIFHICSTNNALKLMKQIGNDSVVERCIKYAITTRKKAADLKLKLLSSPPFLSNSVTPVLLPKRIIATEIKKEMEDQYGILVAGAQSEFWKKSLIRIGHIGFVKRSDTIRCLRSLDILIRDNKK